MNIQFKTILAASLLCTLSAGVIAHVRLIYSGNGQELSWPNPSNISVVIQSVGSDDVMGSSDEIALRNAIDAWNDVTDVTANLVEDTNSSQQARTDWAADNIHLLTFDETNSSGYFPGGSGIVAITPLEFFTSGQLLDADVIFNGKDFRFTTDGTPGRFDIQDVAAHELGHLLGLDHSGVAGATMYPYVDPSIVLHRSLSMDDIGGLRDMYPSQVFGAITGNLKRQTDSSAVPGGYVVVVDGFGRTIGSALADSNGSFRVEGLPSGIFDVWADPLDKPVSSGNLTAGHTIQTDFESKYLGQVTLSSGQSSSMGDQMLGEDVSISLGRIADDYPIRVISGRTVACTVRGSGLVAGSTLTSPDPTLGISSVVWGGSVVNFNVTLPASSPDGHVDLLVTNALGEKDLLPGALEITPSSPTVSNVVPSSGQGGGSYVVQLTGTNFRAGCRVVIGNQVYVEGQVGGCTLVDSSTISLTLATTVAGPHDVVVIDTSGVEGRLSDGFQSLADPAISSLFPEVGASAGGTEVTLRGVNFVPGASVTINGVPQTNVVVLDSETVTFETVAAAPGGPYTVTFENPGGQQSSSAFMFSPQPDPKLSQVSPSGGPQGGGTAVTLSGSGFDAQTQVVFGADPYTGLGGVLASEVTVVGANEIVVTSPSSSSPFSSVLVQDMATTQASVLGAGFTYESSSSASEDFSFGGCHAGTTNGPVTWNRVLAGGAWMLLLYGILIVRLLAIRQQASRPVAAAACDR